MMRILIATDAWRPQVNGVVHTLEANAQAAKALGAEVVFINPEGLPSIGLPSYPDIRLALPRRREIFSRIAAIRPDAIHIATEGPIGHFARWYCVTERLPFTTSFHTRFADYASARFPVPQGLTWAWLRWFHNAGRGIMVSTPSLAAELRRQGFHTVLRWPRGVDSRLFHPDRAIDLGLPRPVFLAVGRLAVEKNVEAFLSIDLPGSKVVVGDGPARERLGRRFPAATFLGTKRGAELAAIYAAADVFVFPSRTDTFGLVLLEALASGLPIAGFPVAATRDVVGGAPVAALDEDLRSACLQALTIPRTTCRRYAETLTWEESARCFIGNVVRIPEATTTPIAAAQPRVLETAGE
ncbi:MAG: glycosyltransferase family 1 protein [Xanthobacteraceae bacterium]|nr:glycosyltransferase family 1 protein [Xanthobacteraceae bacterium]